jgi:hypothetical protein
MNLQGDEMSIVRQNCHGKGSLKDIQLLVNNKPNLLNELINKELGLSQPLDINWLSPLVSNSYAEYCDKDFISLLGLNLNIRALDSFWPSKGPHWDALGKATTGQVFLIEAKANIPELVSNGTSATSKKSLELINKSLIEIKNFLNIKNNIDWSGKFYQYTNRIAHLYLLRELNKIPSYLINIYFLNDSSVDGSKLECEWKAALKDMKCYLGINNHKLSKYMIDLYIDVKYL